MNNIEQKPNAPVEMTPEKKLEIFRVEMKKIKEVEMNKKRAWEECGEVGEAYNPHFDGIDPDYLGQAEQEVYEKYQKDELSIDLFNELKRSAMAKYDKPSADINDKDGAIIDFWAYLSNLVTVREGRRQLEELRWSKNQ